MPQHFSKVISLLGIITSIAAVHSSMAATPCGGEGQRACCIGERAAACDAGYSGSLVSFTCRAEYGVSFMGGSKEDGIGLDLIPEGVPGPNPLAFWNPIEAGVQVCQGSKPLSPVPLGVRQGVNWSPTKLPLQLLVIGQFAIAAVPFELTTVTGRRLRTLLKASLGPRVREVVIAGLSNDYAGYIATKEEYDRQQYEGASTQFGPWTEAALRDSV